MNLFCRAMALRLCLILLILRNLHITRSFPLSEELRVSLKEHPLTLFLPKESREELKVLPDIKSLPIPDDIRIIDKAGLKDLQSRVLATTLDRYYGIVPSPRALMTLSEISSIPWICRQLHRAAGLNRPPASMDDIFRVRFIFPAFVEGLALEVKLKKRGIPLKDNPRGKRLYPAALKRDRRRYKRDYIRLRQRELSLCNTLHYELIRFQMLTELNVCIPVSLKNNKLRGKKAFHPHLLSLTLPNLKPSGKARRSL